MATYENDLRFDHTCEVWRAEIKFPLGKLLILGAYYRHDDESVTCSVTYEGKTGGGISYNEKFDTEKAGKDYLIYLYNEMVLTKEVKLV